MFSTLNSAKTPRCFWLASCGTAAIEMALVFPIFLIFTLGLTGYGIYFGATHSVQQLAADAARRSVAGLTMDERTSLSADYIQKNAAYYPLLRPDKIKVAATPSSNDPDDFVVTVSYDARNLPIWGFAPIVLMPSQQIQRASVIHRGGPQ